MKKEFVKLLKLDEENLSNLNINKNNLYKTNNNISSTKYQYFYYRYSNDNIYFKGEIALWKAVILQALVDLQSKSKKKIANTYRIKSLMWFNLKNEEFNIVCNYAGLNPKYVYKKAQDIKNSNSFFL